LRKGLNTRSTWRLSAGADHIMSGTASGWPLTQDGSGGNGKQRARASVPLFGLNYQLTIPAQAWPGQNRAVADLNPAAAFS
jgi:hypothetical protein